MNLTQASKAALDGVLQSLTTGRYSISPPKDLLRAVDATRTRYGNGQADLVTTDRVEAALAELMRNPEPGRRQLFVLAHALAQPARALGGRTILQAPIGERLLQHWENAAKSRQIKSSHWRGLFHSYLQAEAGDACQRLRGLLALSLSSLGRDGHPIPAWLAAMRQHQRLLGSSPCEPYIDELLRGETSLLDDLLEQVDIPAASWFWVTLRQAIIAQVNGLDEQAFKGRIDHLLRLPERIANARDEILASTLARFANCTDRARHLHLLEFGLEAWGSPQLKSNKLWLLAGEAARHMVSSWLAQEDLEDFYRLCKDAREVDDRRLRFWLRFTEQMGYTHILLGSGIRNSRDPDIRDFVESKRERLGSLVGGLSTNNAILMQIGGWLFVEFSEKGNACYAFPMSEAAVELGQRSYSVSELKPSTKSSDRLLHKDGNEIWETKFQRSLHGVGIYPDARRSVVSASGARTESTTKTSREGADSSPGNRADDDARANYLLAELGRYDVRIVDNRSKGGAIWAYPNSEPFHGYAQLRRLGMKFKAERKGFYWP